jgi:hypothetical protein
LNLGPRLPVFAIVDLRRSPRAAILSACLALLGALAAILLGSPSAIAAPTWLPPTDLSVPGGEAIEPQVALDPAGDAVAVWRRHNGFNYVLESASRPAGGSFSAPARRSVAGGDTEAPQVAMDAAGNTVVVWSQRTGAAKAIVEAASRPAGGTFSAPVALSAQVGNAVNPQVAIDAAGDTVVVWRQHTSATTAVVEAASRPAGSSSFSAAIPVSAPGGNAVDPQVAIDRAGDVTAVWEGFSSTATGAEFIVESASRPAGSGAFSAAVKLSARSLANLQPQVALDPAGDAVAIWSRSDATQSFVESASRPAGSAAFSAAAQLSSPNEQQPQIALDAAGDAVAVWRHFDGTRYVFESASRPAGSTAFSAPMGLSDHAVVVPQIALDPGGDAVAVWGGGNVEATSRPAGGSFSPPVMLSAEGQVAEEPEVALDASGDAVAVWRRSQGPTSTIEAAAYQNVAGQQPHPPPPTPTGHARAIAAHLASLRGNRVLLKLRCPTTAACQGTVKLTVKGGLALGKGSFRIAAGGHLTLSIKLSARGRSLIEAAGHKSLILKLQGTGVKAATVRLRNVSR